MIRYPEGLDTLLSVEDFRMLCPNLSATDEQVAMVLESVSAAIRAWCGWHVAPLTKCQYTGNGSGKLLMLPAIDIEPKDNEIKCKEFVAVYNVIYNGSQILTGESQAGLIEGTHGIVDKSFN